MKRSAYTLLAVVAFLTLTAAGASRYINGTEIPQSVTLLYSTGSQSATLGATTATTLGVSGALTVTGATTHVAAVTFQAPSLVSLAAATSAAGTSKTDCTALTKEFTSITGTALQGVCLPTAAAGKHVVVFNDSAVTLVAYPADADNAQLSVNHLGLLTADQGYAMGPQSSLDCTAYTAAKWRCVYVPGSRASVAAAGTNQATGTALASVNMGSAVAVTAADATKAITLPTGGSTSTYTPGCISVESTVNTNTAYLPIFGNNSDDDTINGAAADAVFTCAAGCKVTLCTTDGVAWVTQ